MKVETAYKVLVVERSTLHGSTCKLYGFHVSDRRYGTSTTHMESYFKQTGALALGLELISDSPTWALGCIS